MKKPKTNKRKYLYRQPQPNGTCYVYFRSPLTRKLTRLPDEIELLPTPERLHGCTVAGGDNNTNPSPYSGNGAGHICEQCGGEPDGTEHPHPIGDRLVWLHRECRRFYQGRGAP